MIKLSEENPPQKKMKKSVRIANEAEVRIIPGNAKTKAFKVKKKSDKKAKFEKPTAAIKSEKPTKPASKKPKENQSKIESEKSVKLEKRQKLQKKMVKGDKSRPATAEGEKPNWLEFKKTKKELKEKRKVTRHEDLYKISIQAKKIGEKLRRASLPDPERKVLCEDLHTLLKGHYNQIIFTHDLSRVIQWLMKYSTAEIRDAAFLELKESWITMLQSKYSCKCVNAAINYGSDAIKTQIVDACYGSVVKLVSQVQSSPTFERLYSKCANKKQKLHLKQEFYGDMYKSAKMDNIQHLKDVYENAEGMKTATLSAVKANLTKILNKELLGSALVHTILYEYLSECPSNDRTEMIVALRSLIMQLSETKDGAMAGVLCIWHSSSKDRKAMIKSLKEHLKDVFLSEHGHTMLMALIDCVDDTVLMKKFLLSEMENDLLEIAGNEYGKKVLLHIVARRNPLYFHPKVIEYFKQGDGNATSKKPGDVREKELLDAVIECLLEKISAEPVRWLADSSIQMVTLAIFKANHEKCMKSVFRAMVDFVVDPEAKIKEEGKEYDAVEHSGLHLMMKKLLKVDQQFREKNKSSLAEAMVEKLDKEVIDRWIRVNRGCFLMVFLVENASENVASNLKTKLEKVKDDLKKLNGNPGAKILLKKLE